MRAIFVSSDFPLNRRMRKSVKRGKLHVVREDDRFGAGGAAFAVAHGISFRASSSPLMRCSINNGESNCGGGAESNDELPAFKSGLEKIVGNPCVKRRPFVCDGSPLDCRICLIGINPATDMPDNFWDFWDDAHGFKREEWLRAYVRSRQGVKKKKIGNSRERIELIVASARPVACLETNLFSAEARRESDLKAEDKDLAAFNFLLGKIKGLRIIAVFTKNKKHRSHVFRALGISSAQPHSAAEEFGGKMFQRPDGIRVVVVKHYKFWGFSDAHALGQWLRKQAEEENPAPV